MLRAGITAAIKVLDESIHDPDNVTHAYDILTATLNGEPAPKRPTDNPCDHCDGRGEVDLGNELMDCVWCAGTGEAT